MMRIQRLPNSTDHIIPTLSLNNPSLESKLLVTVLAESDLVPINVNYTVYMEIN